MASYANATYVRDKVTETLLQMMRERDYQTISVSELVQKADVSRSSFYRNFTDKDDVVQKYLKRLIQDWECDFSIGPNQDLSDSLLRHFYQNRDFYLLLYRSGLSWMLFESIKSACGVRSDAPPVLAYGAASIAGALFGWIDEWISRGMRETPRELKNLAEEFQRSDVMLGDMRRPYLTSISETLDKPELA